MKHFVIITILSLLAINILNSAEDNDILIKRKIAIFPFVNKNNVEEYDYLSSTIRDALRARLQDSELFILTNFSDIDEKITQLKKTEILSNENTLSEIAFKLGADVVVMGSFVIIDNNIMIVTNAVDVLEKASVTSSMINGETGVAIFSLIETLTNEMSGKMAEDFPNIDKKRLSQLIEEKAKELKYTGEYRDPEYNAKKIKQQEIKNSKEYQDIQKKRLGTLGGGITLITTGSLSLFFGVIALAAGISFDESLTQEKSEGLFDPGRDSIEPLIGSGAALISVGVIFDTFAIVCLAFSAKFKTKMLKMLNITYNIKPILQFTGKSFTLGLSFRFS